MRPNYIKKVFTACFILLTSGLMAQEFNDFDIRYQSNLRGDLTFIANNIVSLEEGGYVPEDNYDLTGDASTFNDWLNMQYIDVDSDPTTFSSSSAIFTFPQADCNLIRYAGLYWSAAYPSAQAGQPLGAGRQNDFDQVRFRVPGGSYIDITADEVIYDGFTSADASVQQNSPYACYADVTDIITSLANPEGEYTVANIRSVTGDLSPGGGAAGGWTLVVVYENPYLTGKLITTFDGFARVRTENPTVDIDYSGFNTIPGGPVRADIGVAALEGDNRITGDQLLIRAASNAAFTNLNDAANPTNNFFNSNISEDGVLKPGRTPNSVNTLGYDTDMFLLNNPLNSVLPNSESAATFRFTSQGDQYYPFFNSFNVEIIEPQIILEKNVEDIAGNDITGQGVNLGQLIDYVLAFQNIGNDDGTNYTIRDVLPINVTLIEEDMVLPPGVTYVYDPANREVIFSIPDNLIEEGDPVSEIRMRVRIAENCFDFIDACTNLIQNLAYSTYQGVINDAQITDDPSVSEFNTCGFPVPGATNFLLDDLENCDFRRTVELCGNDVLLVAGANFDQYIWYRDNNGDGLIDGGDTVISDGDPDNDPSTLLVTQTGSYIVDKIVADPCKGFEEIITVVLSSAADINPIVELINDPTNTVEGEVVVCPNDGELLPKIFLCGANDTELLEINIPDATSIEWEKLDEASCMDAGEDCANKNSACSWDTVDTGFDFLASEPGEYRVVVNYQNGCFTRFYFNIFQNPLDPQYNVADIICASPGNITVTNMPADYEYQLLDAVTGAILVPFSDGNGPSFSIANSGAYSIEMRQLGVVDGCVFRLEDIGVRERDFQVDVTKLDADCNGLGSISISILDVEPQYYYEISQGGAVVDTFGPSDDNNYTFENLNVGTYDVSVSTDDGCAYTEQITILDTSDLELTARVSQNITCKEGNILMESSGGKTPHIYAIYEFVDENGVTQISYPSPADVPASEFQTSVIFDIWDPGTYTFVVVDRNNCFDISNPVTIYFEPPAEFAPTTVIDEQCFGDTSGTIQFNVIDRNGYQLTFFLIDETGTEIASNTSGLFTGLPQGDYTVRLNFRKGSASCEYFEYYTIDGPPSALAGDAVLVQDYTCLQQGIVEAQNVTGGTLPYEFSIDGVTFAGGAGAETFSGLAPGTYSITIRDAAGCTFQTNPVTISPTDPPTDIAFTAGTLDCSALTTDLTAVVAGGTQPLSVEIIAPINVAAASLSGDTALFPGLSAGTYTFEVTDADGCTYTENYTLPAVAPIQVAGAVVSNISCFGEADGEAVFTVSNYVSTYSYTVNGGGVTPGQAAPDISLAGLAAGTYSVEVTDEVTGCTDIAAVTIEAPPSPLDFTFAVASPSCVSDGSVTITASGGWGAYSYLLTQPDASILGPQSGNTFAGLTQTGTYTITVRDGGGCEETDSFDLIVPPFPVLSLDPVSVTCYEFGVPASVTLAVADGLAPFAFNVNGGPFQSSNTFGGLTPGTYTFSVIDANGCTDDIAITIAAPLTANAALAKDFDCTVSPDAILNLSVAGGTAPYTYEINFNGGGFAPYGGGFPYTASAAGTYQFRVTDASGCTAESNVIATTPAVNPQATAIATDPACFGDANGVVQIQVDPNFGLAPFEISFNGSGFSRQAVYTGLAAGMYSFTVRDSNECTFTDTVTLTDPALFDAAISVTDVSCSPGGDVPGRVDVSIISGGVANFTYTLYDRQNNIVATTGPNPIVNTPNTSASFDGLPFGDYYIRIIDANGCEFYQDPVRVLASPLLSLNSTVASDCISGGTVTLSADGGSGDYTFSIFGTGTPADSETPGPGPQEETAVFTGLNPGQTYVFEAVDNLNNCTSYIEETIPTLSSIAVVPDPAVTDVSCFGNADGSISFQIEGFDPSVTDINYSILEALTNNPLGAAYSGTVTQPAGGPVATPPVTLNNIPPGDYVLFFEEATSPFCSNIYAFRILEPTPVAVDVIALSSANCNENAGLTVRASGGSGAYTYAFVIDGAAPSGFTSASFTELDPAVSADWDVYAMDVNGCMAGPVDVTITTDPEPLISVGVDNQCLVGDGSFEATVTLDVAGTGPHWLSLDGGPYQASGMSVAGDTFTFTGLLSGNHSISVRDANGCIHSVNFTIEPPLGISALPTAQPSCTATDGEITITAQGGSGNYAYDLLDGGGVSITGGATQASNVFSGLPDGSYTAVVYDTGGSGCSLQSAVPVILVPATPVTFDPHAITDVSCFGGADGAVRVTLTPAGPGVNDNPPYAYSLYDGGGALIAGPQADPWFTGLSAGNYEVEAISGRGCSLREPVVISEPPALTLSASATDFSCAADNTVSESVITAVASGGTGPYLYSLDGVNYFTSDTFTRSDTGAIQNLTVYVRDASGCEASTALSIEPLNTFSASVSQVAAISCANPEQVLISVSEDLADPSNVYTFELLPAGNPNGVLTGNPAYNQATFDLTVPDTYTFRITDTATGCYVDTTYEVPPYDLATVIASPVSPVVCFGDSSGSLSIEVSGYSGPYDYAVFFADGSPSGVAGSGDTAAGPLTIPGLSGGNYFVQVVQTGAPFCQEDSNVVTIVSPDLALAAVVSEVANVTCTNDQGEILVAPEGGYAPFDIILTNTSTGQSYPATGVNTRVFTGLSAGSYTVVVTDAAGCVYTDSIVLTEPLPITADITAAPASLACYGDENGTVSAINVSGGEGSYNYQLNVYDESGSTIVFTSGTQPDPVFTGLGAGIYSITVTDGWNCFAETPRATITEPTEVFSNLVQVSQMTCNNDAEIRLTATGGTGPYQYSTDGINFSPMSGGNTHTFSVADGVYQYYVRDSFGCEADLSNQVSIEPVAPLVLTIDDSAAVINCTGEATASFTAVATGALGNYQYSLYADATLSTLLAGPQAEGTFSGLPAGSYWVRATSVDCEEVSPEIIIDEPVPLQIDREEFTNVTCSGEADGTITVEVSGGTGTILYAITPNLNQFDTVNTFTDLEAGVYDVIAQDENGCFIPFQFTITEPLPLEVSATAMPEVCVGTQDGSIEVTITGGTAPYSTAFNSNQDADFVEGQTSFPGLETGTYVIFVRDAQGCETNTIVEIAPGVNLGAQVTPMYECTDILPDNYLEVVLDDPSMADQVMYALDSTDPADMQLEANFASIAPGPHYLAISHANGCVLTIDFEIAAFEPLTLTLQQSNINEITAIAAGGQPEYTFFFNEEDYGTDNTYNITETGTYTVRVVDQNGCVAEAQIFMEFMDIVIPNFFTPDGDGMNDFWTPQNIEAFPEILIKIYDRYGRVVAEVTAANAWDGTYDARELPTGDYWYVIKLNGENDTREFVGHFTLYR